MLAIGQKVVCVTAGESTVHTLIGARRTVVARVVYINRPNRWFLVVYRGARGERIREAFSFHDIGRVVTAKKRRKEHE